MTDATGGSAQLTGLRVEHLDAAIFDLDGVLTDTASLHAQAWKQTFDELLDQRAGTNGTNGVPFVPFDSDVDYRTYVDGRLRFDGANGFLVSRGVELPDGQPTDPPGRGTVWAVANAKNQLFAYLLAERGVHVFAEAVRLLEQLRAAGVRTAVVTASRNAEQVLRAAGIADLFDARVDGVNAAALGLPGKPDPATYLEAARRLAVSPDRAVIFEDAPAGVEAGRRGGFGLVIGVDRAGGGRLSEAGADVVVAHLAQLPIDLVRLHELPGVSALPGVGEDFLGGGSPHTGWVLRYEAYDPAREGLREALCTTGNGYMATRGAAPECDADGVHYPGTYLAGVYNRLTSAIDGRTIEHEQMVNAPNWLPLRFRIVGQPWFHPDTAQLLDYRMELDLRSGVLSRFLRWCDAEGRQTRVEQHRFVHMGAPHLAALQTTFIAENWSGELQVEAGIDGNVVNANLPEDAPLNKSHLLSAPVDVVAPDIAVLTSVTTQSQVRISMAARTRFVDPGGRPLPLRPGTVGADAYAGQHATVQLAQHRPVTVEKVVAVATSRDPAISEPGLAVRLELQRAGTFADLLISHKRAWARLWDQFELAMDVSDEVALALRLHIFHLLQTLSPHTSHVDAGVPARGLHGEGYHGHVFWDEMFVFPTISLRLPNLSRALLLYRWRRLSQARHAARAAGLRGAMFPWQSASDGREETPTELFDPKAGTWYPDYSSLQRHIGAAIVYDVWQYYQATGDIGFLADYGGELIIEVARFLASLVEYDPADGRFGISGVLGPDEYHDRYPDADEPGLRDNAYTNVMTAWVLCRALSVIDLLAGHHGGRLWEQLGISTWETERWGRISRRMRVPFHDGVISQFAGYENLAEFDWDGYRKRYGELIKIDTILRAEGDAPNRYKLSKQADVLMLLYLFSAEELRELFARLGYDLDAATIERTVEYYLARVAHGSSLSSIVHAWVRARANREHSWLLFTEALRADVSDERGSSTRYGIHLGAMAGTVDLVLRCYTGLEARGDELYLHPLLPAELRGMHAEIRFRGHWVVLDINHERLQVTLRPGRDGSVRIRINGELHEMCAGEHVRVPLGKGAVRASRPTARR